MSPHVGNFVHDLVEMAKAMERVPGLEAEIARLQGMVDNYAQQVQAIELRAIDRNTEIEQLNAKIRSLEVERDDASFRELEAEDRVATAVDRLNQMGVIVRQVLGQIDPPKPQPEPEAVAQPPHLGAQDTAPMGAKDPLPHGENTQPTSGSLTPSAEQSPIDPHQTEAPVSVSADPTIASTTESAEAPHVHTATFQGSAAMVEPSIERAIEDPEPNERWSNEWYAWKDRQYKQA